MTNRRSNTVLILLLPLLLLSSLQAIDWIKAYDEYPQCDGIDREGVVHPEKKNGKINGFAEKICVKKEALAEKEEALAEKEEKFRKLTTILFLLSPKEFQNEKKKVIAQIEAENDPKEKKRLEEKLAIFEKIEKGEE